MPKQNASDPDSKNFQDSPVKSAPFGQTDNMTPGSGGPGSKPGSSQVPVQTKNSAVRRLTTA